ncbi:MAG: BatD family protein [Aureispira sp.]
MKQSSLFQLVFLITCLCSLCHFAQGQRVSFEAASSTKETITGELFEVSFRLTNARPRKFDAPVFNGLDLRGGPKQSSSYASINGITVISEVFSYYVVAKKPGTYRIGPATVITSKGKSLRSQTITIKVKQAKRSANPLQGKAFVRAEVNKTKAVVGEQITLDYRIYTQVRIEQQQLLNYPSFDKAYVYDLNDYTADGEILTVNGEEYYSRSLRRTAIFPSESGKIIIEPIGIAISVLAERAGSHDPYRLRQYKLYSDSVVINVRQLDGAPTGFNGAIGQYELQAHLNKASIRSHEVVQLTLRVVGAGNIKNVLPPTLQLNKRYFDSFAPTVEEQLRMVNQLQGGIKTFEYVLTPKALGEYTIRPRLVYFDGEARRFVTLDTTLTVVVQEGNIDLPTKAERDTAQSAAAIVAAENAAEALQYGAPIPLEALHATPLRAFWGSSLFWILLLLPLLLLAGFLYYQQQQEHKAHQPVAEQRRQAAGQEANKRLQQAQKALEARQATVFYKEISKALLGFVSDRYQLSTVELTKQNVQQQLEQQGVETEKIQQLLAILATSERAIFAGLADTASMEKIQQESQVLIEQLQQ